MRLEQLEYLLEISKCHSLTLAADRLFITQPALSRAIISLEEELGVELLSRTSSGVSLTENAKILIPKIQKILLQIEGLKSTASSLNNPQPIFEETSFNIATSAAVIDTYLPLVLRIYREEYPLVDININLKKTQELIALAQENTNNLLLVPTTTDNQLDNIDELSSEKILLLIEDYSAVVRCDSKFAQKRFLQLKDALNNKLILGNNGIDLPSFYTKEIKYFSDLDILLMSNNIDIVKEMILAYDALFISNNTLISNSDFGPSFKIIPLKNKKGPARTLLYACYSKYHPQKVFIDAFLSTFKIYQHVTKQ